MEEFPKNGRRGKWSQITKADLLKINALSRSSVNHFDERDCRRHEIVD